MILLKCLKQNEGLKSHEKFGLQLIGSAIFVGLYLLSGNAPLIYIPFFGEVNSIIISCIIHDYLDYWIFKCCKLNRWTRWFSSFNKYDCLRIYGFIAYMNQVNVQSQRSVSVVGGPPLVS